MEAENSSEASLLMYQSTLLQPRRLEYASKRCKNCKYCVIDSKCPITLSFAIMPFSLKHFRLIKHTQLIPVAVQSQAQVCGLSIAGIAGWNPAEGMEFRRLCLLCVMQVAACATSWSFVQRSPQDACDCACVCQILCDLESSTMRRPRPDFGCSHRKGNPRIPKFILVWVTTPL